MPKTSEHAGAPSAAAIQTELNRVIAHAITQRLEAHVFLAAWQQGDWDACREFGFEPASWMALPSSSTQTDGLQSSQAERLDVTADQEPSRYQEIRDALESLMEWQVKHVKVWRHGTYDHAARVIERHDATPEAACDASQQMTAEQIRSIEDMRRTLEIIAVGDSVNPAQDACNALIQAGFWAKDAVPSPKTAPTTELPSKPPGMAVQALAGEIIEALLADEKDGGYDLTGGLFGAEFSKLVRRWAEAEWAVASMEKMKVTAQVDRQALIEELCAKIKAADDKALDEANYMLDSNDCIKVLRGEWQPHETPQTFVQPKG